MLRPDEIVVHYDGPTVVLSRDSEVISQATYGDARAAYEVASGIAFRHGLVETRPRVDSDVTVFTRVPSRECRPVIAGAVFDGYAVDLGVDDFKGPVVQVSLTCANRLKSTFTLNDPDTLRALARDLSKVANDLEREQRAL